MKNSIALVLIMSAAFARAQSTVADIPIDLSEKNVVQAQRLVTAKPGLFSGYNQLAMALLQRGQETADPRYYTQAQEAVSQSLLLAPGNFETGKVQVSILLAQHDYPAALEQATALNKKVPDDVTVYGLLTDADVALGKYDDAEKAAQWMLNLRPGNVPALTRAAHLRDLFGDPEGSAELLNMVLDSTSPADVTERAWVLTELGHLRLTVGDRSGAEQFLQEALKIYPGWDDALDGLAEVRIAQKRYDEAVTLLRQSYAAAPHTERLYSLAQALQLGKHDDEAGKAFSEFESAALAKTQLKNNSNLDLIFYYADQANLPLKALDVARREYSWRRDVYTLDAYAWALHANGKDEEARRQVECALAVGIHDAGIFRHAGEIALQAGDRTAAERYLKQSSDLNTTDSQQRGAPWQACRKQDRDEALAKERDGPSHDLNSAVPRRLAGRAGYFIRGRPVRCKRPEIVDLDTGCQQLYPMATRPPTCNFYQWRHRPRLPYALRLTCPLV